MRSSLHIEVEFLPLYMGQPLFSGIEVFLRQRGYLFHRFSKPIGRVIQPLVIGDDIMAGLSQLVWTDAVFIRDFTRPGSLGDDRLLAMAAIAHDCYKSLDLALHLLCEYDRRTGQTLGQTYLAGLTGAAQSAPPATQPKPERGRKAAPRRKSAQAFQEGGKSAG